MVILQVACENALHQNIATNLHILSIRVGSTDKRSQGALQVNSKE